MSERVLLFTTLETTFVLSAALCREVFSPTRLLPLPAAETALIGLTEVRGRSVPLLDLAALRGETGARERPALALLADLQGELLAFPVEQMLGVSLLGALPTDTDTVFETVETQDRAAQYIHSSALLQTLRARLIRA